MAPTIKLDPQTYYDAARTIGLLADQTVLPFIALHNALHANPGMAGNYTGVDAWTTPYDSHVEEFHQAFVTYTNALQHFGDVLNAAGYNWDIANYNADANPNKGAAPDKPTAAADPPIKSGLPAPPSAKSVDARPGLDEGPLHGLFDRITRPVPNGDLGKLAAVHTAWDACAKHDAITTAAGTIKRVNDTFSDNGTVDPHLPRIQDHLTTLSTAADRLAQASTSIAAAVGAHHDQLQALRTKIQDDRTRALIAIGATVVAFATLWCVTIFATEGIGAAATGEEAGAAGAATEAEITAAATAISSDIATSSFPALLADGSEIFGTIGQFTRADTQLLVIQSLIVATTSGDSGPDPNTGGGGTSAHTKPSGVANLNATPKGHPTTVPANEAPENQEALRRENESASILAKEGYDVEQNPSVPGAKNPDYRIEGQIFDNVAPTSGNPRSIASRIQQKVEDGQTDRIVVNLEGSSATAQNLKDQLNNYPIPGLKEVKVIDQQGKVIDLYP